MPGPNQIQPYWQVGPSDLEQYLVGEIPQGWVRPRPYRGWEVYDRDGEFAGCFPERANALQAVEMTYLLRLRELRAVLGTAYTELERKTARMVHGS